jgi:hypothetical protein
MLFCKSYKPSAHALHFGKLSLEFFAKLSKSIVLTISLPGRSAFSLSIALPGPPWWQINSALF